jgi:hypothetical protein
MPAPLLAATIVQSRDDCHIDRRLRLVANN